MTTHHLDLSAVKLMFDEHLDAAADSFIENLINYNIATVNFAGEPTFNERTIVLKSDIKPVLRTAIATWVASSAVGAEYSVIDIGHLRDNADASAVVLATQLIEEFPAVFSKSEKGAALNIAEFTIKQLISLGIPSRFLK